MTGDKAGRRVQGTEYLVLFGALTGLIVAAGITDVSTKRALLNSAILASSASAIALPLGTLLAVLLTRYDLPGCRVAIACLGVLLFLPLYVQLSGWDACLGKLGWFSIAYGSMAKPILAGMRGAILVHGFAAVPWAALLIGLGLMQVDPAQEESALLVVPPRQVLWRITLPQTRPFILAAVIWIVVSTTAEMTVTNIFLINPSDRTFTEQFYMAFALSADAGDATVAVLPGAVALGILITASLWMIAQFGSRRRLAHANRSVRFSAGRLGALLSAVLWSIVLTLLAIPIISLISKAGFIVLHEGGVRVRSWSAAKCLTEIVTAPWRFAGDFVWTLIVAASAASLALAIGIWLAWQARRGGWRALPAIASTVVGLAVPGPLVGVALIWLLNHDLPPHIPSLHGGTKSWLLVLYDETPLAPMLAQAIRALPLAILISWHSFRTLSDNVLAAAALDGASPRRVFWRIALPQRQAALIAAWLAAFAVAAGDLAWAHLVTPPGMDLIQRRVFGLVHSGVEEQVAAISLVNIIIYALLSVLILRFLRRSSVQPS